MRAKHPGRHSGGSKFARVQRGRIIAAIVEVAAECGVSKLSVATVVARSGVSRRTFYEIFADGQDCLLAALEDSLEQARSYVLDAYKLDDPWRVRIRAALYALLCFLEDEPSRGRLLVVDALGAGPLALERRARVLDELIRAIDEGRADAERSVAVTSLTAEGVVGSVMWVLHARFLKPGPLAFVELTNSLMSMVVLPYLGAGAARKELDCPLPEDKRRPVRAANGASRLNGLPMRVTYRTMCVLTAVAARPGASNRELGGAADIADQGQVSKLLRRLQRLGLIVNVAAGPGRGMPNAWKLTPLGVEVERAASPPRKPGL